MATVRIVNITLRLSIQISNYPKI